MKYFILSFLLFFFACTSLYGADCNVEQTECTVVFGEQYGFGWKRNHANDDVFGYRVYEAETSGDYTQGNQDQIFFDIDLLRDDNVCEGTFPDGECQSPPFVAISEEKTFYYVVTALDSYEHESDFSNEVIIHIKAPEGIRNLRIK